MSPAHVAGVPMIPVVPAIPPPEPVPKPVLYSIDARAASLLAAVGPIREWRKANIPGNSPPPELKPLADILDALSREAHRYVGERLEAYPL